MSYDAHKNFATSLIAVAPIPAASGTTFEVTAGEGALFPAAPFNAVVHPAGAQPTAANAEIVRVTNKGTGDNFTATRTQESTNARAIAVGDVIFAGVTGKMISDIQNAQLADAAAIAAISSTVTPGGRLSLTTAVPVTTSDVTAAGTLYYVPYIHNQIQLYNGSAWVTYTFPELSIAVPAAANQVYDVFVYDNAGTRTLELLAWTNDTTRATALVRQDGRLCKTGALTRLYVGTVRTVSASQLNDSLALRHVWNYYNRTARPMRVTESTDSWAYNGVLRQARATATNQLDFVVGVQEVEVEGYVIGNVSGNASSSWATVSIGEDSTSAADAGVIAGSTLTINSGFPYTPQAQLKKFTAVGRHTWVWLEAAGAATTTWYGDNGGTQNLQSGIHGTIRG